jgi:hypothetical protein
MKSMKFATTVILILFMVVSIASTGHARRIGLTLGSGLSLGMGDLADRDKYGCKVGPRFSLGVDVFPIQAFSVGPFINGDVFKPNSILFKGETVSVTSIATLDVGISARYFFRKDNKLQPYFRIWMGYSSLTINLDNGGGGTSDGTIAWGTGVGLMYLVNKNLGLSSDLLYNNSKTQRDNGETTSRINLSLALNVLF